MFNPYPQTPIDNRLLVSGIDEAKAYPLPANSVAVFTDKAEPYIYVKTTNGIGLQQDFTVYKIEKVELETQSSNYVSKTEFDRLESKINELITQLGGTK